MGSWGEGGLSPAGGAVGLVLARQAGTSSVDSCPRGQQGPHWRVTFLHLGPQGTRQLSAQSHRLASQFLLLCRGVSAHT